MKHSTARFSGENERLSLHDTDSHDAVYSRRENDRVHAPKALQALTEHVSVTHDPAQDQNPSHEDPHMTRARSKQHRRQGNTNWREALTDNTTMPACLGLVSATGKVYGLGDPSAGYRNGDFVTILEPTKPQEQESKRS
jgi:hypothetical protein